MGYISFYRKWRPQKFDEIIGQKYNIQTLKNMLDGKRLSHSYMFCGPRGTGKTSTARILAKAINCKNGISSSPCGKCSNCTSISDGSNVDVVEIDAASNRGINEIRELREKVKYLPGQLRKKVYIIDEVHMLTTEAFNALLKVLEEPPEHVIFIMATTEPNKVIPTIMSRCQRFDFYPIPLDLIEKRLSEVSKAEKISISDAALGLVAKYADGSLRDADGILEQLAAYSQGKIGPPEVIALLGVVDIEILFEFVDILASRDIKKGLEITDRIIKGNQDLASFTSGLIDHLYDLYTVKNYDKPAELIALSRDYLDRYKKQAEKLEGAELDYYLEHFTGLLKQIKWSESSRTVFKASVIQALNHIVLDDRRLDKKARAWDARMAAIERKVNNLSSGPINEDMLEENLDIISKRGVKEPGHDSVRNLVSDEDAAREISGSGRAESGTEKGSENIETVKDNMDMILKLLKDKKVSIYAMFIEAVPGRIEDNTLYFYLEKDKKWHTDRLNKAKNSDVISEVINEATGKKYAVKFEAARAAADKKEKNAGSGQEAEKDKKKAEEPRETEKEKSAPDNGEAVKYFKEKFDIKE